MSKTYENIKQRVLNNTNIDVDKREGSFLNNMASPLAYELARFYIEQQDLVNMSFVKNGYFHYLDTKCAEYGITRKQGTKSTGEVICKGTDGTVISNDTLLFYNDLNYVVLNDAEIVNGEALLYVEALEVGNKYNLLSGTKLDLVETIYGVKEITVKETFKTGTNIESDEELRDRFFTTIRKNYTSGNVAHYEMWTLEVDGTGMCKVYPLKHGNGTVEVVVTNSDMLGASEELLRSVKNNIESKRPIGASVTVVSAIEKEISVTADLTIEDEYLIEDIEKEFKIEAEKYLKDIAFTKNYISIARLSNILLSIDGVIDYSNFKLNNSSNNITLSDTNVPKLTSIKLEVV